MTISITLSCETKPPELDEFKAFKSETACDKGTKTLEFETFRIRVPCEWKIDTVYGIDTPPLQVIKTDARGGIIWGYGSGYNSDSNYEHKKVLSNDLLDSMLTHYRDTSRYRFVNLRPNEIVQEDFYRFKDTYVVIDGLNAKITTLRNGYGVTEIDFDSSYLTEIITSPFLKEVKNKGLYISGIHLNQNADSLFRIAFKTIEFKRE